MELHAFGFQQICWVMLSTCTLILTLAFTTVVSDCGPLLRRQVPPQDMGSGVTGSLSASQDVRQAVGQVGQVPRVVAHHANFNVSLTENGEYRGRVDWI